MSITKLIRKKKAKFSRKLMSIEEIGRYEDGTWKFVLRFGDGTTAQFQEKDTTRAMSFLAEIVNRTLAKGALFRSDDDKAEEPTPETTSSDNKEETGK